MERGCGSEMELLRRFDGMRGRERGRRKICFSAGRAAPVHYFKDFGAGLWMTRGVRSEIVVKQVGGGGWNGRSERVARATRGY